MFLVTEFRDGKGKLPSPFSRSPRIVFNRSYSIIDNFPKGPDLLPDKLRNEPGLIHVNREARYEALKVYQTYPEGVHVNMAGQTQILSSLCFDPEVDTLLGFNLQDNHTLTPASPQNFPMLIRKTVWQIAIHNGLQQAQELDIMDRTETDVILLTQKTLRGLPALEKVVIIVLGHVAGRRCQIPQISEIAEEEAQGACYTCDFWRAVARGLEPLDTKWKVPVFEFAKPVWE